jgi:hypothetical protein
VILRVHDGRLRRVYVLKYRETTSNLITLSLSANSAGITIQPETRSIFDTMNDLMGLLGLPQE